MIQVTDIYVAVIDDDESFRRSLVRLLRAAGDPRGDVTITLAAQNQHVTWQGGGTLSCPLGHGPLDCPVPVRDATWGLIKSMYR